MAEYSRELIEKLKEAQSLEEVEELLKAAGEDASAEQVWSDIVNRREEQELSIDELEAVAGGADRDWLTDGCDSTVEAGSNCWSSDYCVLKSVTYKHAPYGRACPRCGGQTYNNPTYCDAYKCRDCGYEFD